MASLIDSEIAAMVARQHGFITRSQLLELGLGRHAIQYRVKAKRLLPVYAGVYAFGHIPDLMLNRSAGAVLACGPTAALSHASAMCLWGFWRHWSVPFEVVVTEDRRRRGIQVHRRTTLTHRDVTHQYAIRVTSPARTILDIAPRLSDRRLTRVVNDARQSRVLRLADLWELLQRHPGQPATARLVPFVTDPAEPTRSEFEDFWKEFAARYGLPKYELNAKLGRRVLDVLFVEQRLIVELDGVEFHSSRAAFESDRERDAAHLELGLATVRITWRRFTGEPDREAARLHRILATRP